MSILFYKRPSYVEPLKGPLRKNECQKLVEKLYSGRSSIPEQFSFDNVVNHKTQPPCSLQDFMDYSVYIAHDAENLQFFLWLKDYTKRFHALKKEEQALSPKRGLMDANGKQDSQISLMKKTPALKSSYAFLTMSSEFAGSIQVPPEGRHADSIFTSSTASKSTLNEVAENTLTQAGLTWQPFTVQPFREEISMVISHYLAQSAPRELNLSHRDRTAVLHALQHTTHPSAFESISTIIETVLRGQSHPNFIRWSICNGNKPNTIFVRSVGVLNSVLGVLLEVFLTVSRKHRGLRLIPLLLLFIGLTCTIASYKGLCLVLYSKGHMRRLRPWEEVDPAFPPSMPTSLQMLTTRNNNSDEEATVATTIHRSRNCSGLNRRQSSIAHPHEAYFGFGNEYADEEWVKRYKKKSLLKKLFDDYTWIQDPGMRDVQNRIVRQSLLWGGIWAIVTMAGFVMLPVWGVI
ncbi:hypothetical protein EJ08DRAFT_387049 [Tothia fuscella]|uniref:RGS domain-containing protein n=1 Tax=Tothia fuscella TaxID=1048955 RepID=A0A9P4U2X8_9PEZI|nr:hypothetical protein EJ08DRAFT_387049 [Tothia fuscella]